MADIMSGFVGILESFIVVLVKFAEAAVPAEIYQYGEGMFNDMLVGVAPTWNEINEMAMTVISEVLL